MSMHGPSPSSELPEKLLDPSPNAPWPGNERNTNVPAMILRNFGVRHGKQIGHHGSRMPLLIDLQQHRPPGPGRTDQPIMSPKPLEFRIQDDGGANHTR
jgi:hypothetical protein